MSFIINPDGSPEISEPCTLLDLRKFIVACAAYDMSVCAAMPSDAVAVAQQLVDAGLVELRATPGVGGWHPSLWEFRRLLLFFDQVNEAQCDRMLAIALPMLTQGPDALLDGIEIHVKNGTFRMTDRVAVVIEDR